VTFGGNLKFSLQNNNAIISSAPFLIDPVAAKTSAALPAYTAAGNTLTRNSNGSINGDSASFDGYASFIIGRRVLVDSVGTIDATHNGVYTVTALGSGGAPWVLTRTSELLEVGTVVFVTDGTTFGGTSFMQSETNAIIFRQYSSVPEITADNVGGTGLGVFDSASGTVLQFNRIAGSSTVSVTQPGGAGESLVLTAIPGGIDHGSLADLSADDHSQYVLLAGRNGGQVLIGGNAANNSLELQSTSHSTKGLVRIPEITPSTLPTNGALVVAGGVGVGGRINAAGDIATNGNFVTLPGATVSGVNLVDLNDTITRFVSGTAGAALDALTPSTVAQIVEIGGNTINTTRWGYLATMNQSVRSTDAVTFASVTGVVNTASQPNILHDSLAGLTVGHPHTQYPLMAGSGAGQIITGGTAANANLVLRSTASGTKGSVLIEETTATSLPSNGALRVAGGVGVVGDIRVGGSVYVGANLSVSGGLINSVNLVNLNSNFGSLPSRLYTSGDLTNGILQNAIASLTGITVSAGHWTSLTTPNTASGVVVTDISNKIAIAQVPTGTTGSTVALGDHTHDFRRNGTIAANTNLATPFALPLLTETSGAFRVSIYASIGNGPAAVFELCKNSTSTDAGAVARVVSQVVNGAELSMTWTHGQSPRVFHSTLTGSTNNVTYTYTVAL
jgi:hypothetical protein